MTHFEVKGHSHPEAEALAYATVKALMERHGGPVGFAEDPSPPDLPDQAMPEVEATAQRLVAGGWQADKAALLARLIVARRLGLPDEGPAPGGHDSLALAVELVREVFGEATAPQPGSA